MIKCRTIRLHTLLSELEFSFWAYMNEITEVKIKCIKLAKALVEYL